MYLTMEKAIIIKLYREMLLIRKFEEMIQTLVRNKELHMPVHLSIWQEAISVWLCANLNNHDYVFWNHRSHGHYLAKWGNINKLVAEIFGKETWCSKWIWGSMHINDMKAGVIGTSSIVWWTIAFAAGTALASSLSKKPNISVCFFWDGAMDEWIIYETINFSVLKKLPILFVCENNLYATHVPINKHLSNTHISDLVSGFHITSYTIDWNNAIEVYVKTKEIIDNVRKGKWPVFIEFQTYRINGHVTVWTDFDALWRRGEEISLWKAKCPILQLKTKIVDENILKQNVLNKIDQEIEIIIDKALGYAKRHKSINKKKLERLVFSQ